MTITVKNKDNVVVKEIKVEHCGDCHFFHHNHITDTWFCSLFMGNIFKDLREQCEQCKKELGEL